MAFTPFSIWEVVQVVMGTGHVSRLEFRVIYLCIICTISVGGSAAGTAESLSPRELILAEIFY